MKMKTGFRNTQWDPLLLVAQIIAVQSILYVCLGFIMAVLDVFVGANHTLDHLFQYHVSDWLDQQLLRLFSWWLTLLMLFYFIFSAGNSCDWFGRTFGYSLICIECFYWCFDTTIYRWTYKTLLRFHLYISFYPFIHMLVL